MPPILLQLQVCLPEAFAILAANYMAVIRDTAGPDAVADLQGVHGAGWQRGMEMGLGLHAALMIIVLGLGPRVRTVERETARLVAVVAEIQTEFSFFLRLFSETKQEPLGLLLLRDSSATRL